MDCWKDDSIKDFEKENDMKKSLFIILMVCLALVGLVSCKNEIEPAQEELVSVSFENGTSRALSATLEDFDVKDYYWSYEAKKNDGSGLKSGETGWDVTGEESVHVQEDKGLSTIVGELITPTKVPGFSKGYWNFRLFAYKDASRQQLAYWGEADAVLITENYHTASVTVSPISGGAGYLKVGTITFNPASSISDPTGLVVFNDVVSKYNESSKKWEPLSPQEYSYDSDTKTYTLDAKQYMFTRTYSYEGINVASGSVLVTVYSNLTTTVSGSLSEMTSYAQFDAKQNPDAVNVVASASDLTYDTESTATHTLVVESSTKVQATVTQGSVNEIIASTASALNIGLDENTSTDMTLCLGVDTVASTATSVVYEINMTAEINYKKTVGEQTVLDETTTADVKAVQEYVTAIIQMQTGLLNVSVLHDGNPMVDSTDTSEDQGQGIYSYDSSTGVLTIVTKTFSPFAVNFSFPENIAVARIGTVYYNSLEEAVAAVPSTGVQTVIFMLRDTSLEAGVTIAAGQNVALELNGKRISGNTDSTTSYALITNKGTLTIQDLTDTEKNGTGTGLLTTYITNPDHQDVPGYASNTITNNGILTVESGRIVNNGSGYACFAIDNQTNGTSYNPVLIIYGGRFEQMNAYTYAIRMFCNSTTNVNKAVVNGGVITGGYGFWLQTPNGNANKASLEINGGEIIARDGFALFFGGSGSTTETRNYSETTILISDGIIDGGIGVGGVADLAKAPKEICVSGGLITTVQCGANIDNFITGGQYHTEPETSLIADGYYSEYDEVNEIWVVYPAQDAPMAKVIRYMYDKNNPGEKGYVNIESAVQVYLDKDDIDVSHIEEIILGAVNEGTFVSFLPRFNAFGKTASDLPEEDFFYSGGHITDSIDPDNPGWRVDFKLTANDDFEEGEIGIVGQYLGFSPVSMDCPSCEAGQSMYFMEYAYESLANYVKYDLLLGLCSAEDESNRPGFNCGAYVNDESAYGKSITVELILTNDKKVEVVCATVVCTFHNPVFPETQDEVQEI